MQPLFIQVHPRDNVAIVVNAEGVTAGQNHELRGFGDIVEAIMRFAEKRLAELSRRERRTTPASHFVVGLQCGGSDAFSGVTCNPAVGYAADLLVRAGGTVMFSEVTEVRDAIHLLTSRAANEQVARALVREMKWYDDYLARGSADRSANPTPGNKRGGLANVVEKPLGSIAKSGSTAIQQATSHGERVKGRGLVFAATPASDFICGTQRDRSRIERDERVVQFPVLCPGLPVTAGHVQNETEDFPTHVFDSRLSGRDSPSVDVDQVRPPLRQGRP